MERLLPIVTVLLMSLLALLGDYFLKLASHKESVFLELRLFSLGFLCQGLSLLGWVYAMRHFSLATLGVYYSVSTILFLAILGVFVFGEKLTSYEIIGIGGAIGSLFLLWRFA
jgi:drug/metabolite transporter (DMT)-like permease